MYKVKINEARKAHYIQAGLWGDKTLLDHWNDAVTRFQNREYVVDNRGSRLTYAQVDRLADRLAKWFVRSGIRPGDVISYQIPIWSEFVVVAVACLKAGAVGSPVGLSHTGQELARLLSLTRCRLFLCLTRLRGEDRAARVGELLPQIPHLHTVIALENEGARQSEFPLYQDILSSEESLPAIPARAAGDPNQVALILFTSGTTAGPKAAMLTHNNILASELGFNRGLGLGREDIMFMPAPLHHATGFLHGIIAPMLLGAKLVLQERFRSKEAVELMNRERCTYSMGATPFVYDLLRELDAGGGGLPHLRFYLCGGAPVAPELIQRAWSRYGVKICEVYGLTESAPHVFVRPDEALWINGTSAGRPMDGVEVRIVDAFRRDVSAGTAGEEASRGPNVFVGYLNDPAATDSALDDDGWFYSGDLCVRDEEGNIRVIGRKKDVLIRGGENFSINDLNAKLDGCPGVEDHMVVGMPDDRLGERICAYLVPKDGQNPPTKESVVEFLRGKQVAKCYWPEHIELIDAIPRTESGKVKRYVLEHDIRNRMGLPD